MIVFDMDGVLVDIDSSWKFVHQRFGKTNQENLEKYLIGEINYHELIRRDVALWGDIHISELKKILMTAPLMNGAYNTISTLKSRGYTPVIISAGIWVLATHLQEKLGIDYAYANELAVDETGIISGTVENVVELLRKADVLKDFVLKMKVKSQDCAIVGDSAFDIPLFQEAGFSIAFNTIDSKVQEAADVAVNSKDLTNILSFL